MVYDMIIVGAGAAGLFCSATLPRPLGARRGLILEKTACPGTKLLMSGGGSCNITHSGSIKDFVSCYGKNGGKIRSCLYRYHNMALIEFLEQNGVPTATREDGKVFPRSMAAKDILSLLLAKTDENGFSIKYGSRVTGISQTAGKQAASQLPADRLWQVKVTDGETFTCKNLIIASGGCSYPTTGSDGSMFTILSRDVNLSVIPPRPALAPVNVEDYPYGDLSGIGLADVWLSVFRNGKKVAEATGDLLFTHQNFSGPLMLNLSREILPGDTLHFNYLHPSDTASVSAELSTLASECKGSLPNLIARKYPLPKRLIRSLIGNDPLPLKQAAAKLTQDCFTVSEPESFSKAMATAGGISLSEINLKTMAAKNHPGLYIIGEALDIDGNTGGYNLQFAYSSARAAGNAIMGEEKTNDKKPLY